jgi:ATP-dependent RNA helicase RhlE
MDEQAVWSQALSGKEGSGLLPGGALQDDVLFAKLGLGPTLLEAVRELGYREPTPIQAQTIPRLLEGKDVIGSAQTGTGKTAAFGLPILHLMEGHQSTGPRLLVLEPTRELAAQTGDMLTALGKFTNLRLVVVYGGVGYERQRDAFRRGVDVVVATPGRLLDHLRQRALSLKHVRHLVLDEADRMLDMGFLPDVRRIVGECPRRRQTSLFSATIPPEIEGLIRWAMHQPVTIQIGQRRSPAETVKHVLYPVAESQKQQLLLALLEQVHWESVIVFCRTRRGADKVLRLLKQRHHKATVIHSDRSQKERQQALEGFREGSYEVLVATDIAARGLDIADVTHVINYDVPEHPEDYVHRIGRTGRAQAAGDALTIMLTEDAPRVDAIERFIGRRIERVKLEGFDYQYALVLDKGRRTSLPTGRVRGGPVGRGGYYAAPSRKRRR